MAKNETVVRFEEVSFEYGHNKPILDEVTFGIRRGSKMTIMGQNGAGKSTLFGLIRGTLKPENGTINRVANLSIATARQVIPREELTLTVREFFQKCFSKPIYDIDPRIDEVLEAVNLKIHEKVHDRASSEEVLRPAGRMYDRIMKTFSGGQQARLLLASALIQEPDLLLLDEPTNNLDRAGIEHLTKFLQQYKKTVLVISHDSEFLNAFTEGVLYLDLHTRKIEQYIGNYYDMVKEISVRIEKENSKNARLAKEIQEKKDKANFFANKGGQMRMVAKRMRAVAADLEEEKVDVRKEDKTIRNFAIPVQEDVVGDVIHIDSFTVMHPKTHKIVSRKADVTLKRNNHLLLRGPNGIGKSTLLESIATGSAKGVTITPGTKIGYYRQDFSTLDFNQSVYESLMEAAPKQIDELVRATAAGFLIGADVIRTKIGSLSEGQKGLVAFARLVLERPGLLILDEPTNHINFRHIPVIAKALSGYQGAMILVSHVPEFIAQIRIDETLDLEK